jgi:hypothetical protein
MHKKPRFNHPLPIEDNPIIWTMVNGRPMVHPPDEKVYVAAAPTDAPDPFPVPVNHPARNWPVLNGYVSGISLQLSAALHRSGMYHYERALKLLTHLGYAGKGLWRNEFIAILSGEGADWMPAKSARNAFDQSRGKFEVVYKTNDRYKGSVKRNRKRFSEFVPKIVPKDILLEMERTKSGTNSRRARRGRPSTEWIYIPTEDELWELLIASGLADKLDCALSTSPCYEFYDDIRDMPKHKAVILGTFVIQWGTDRYSRAKLAALTNVSKSTAKKYCERIGILVEKQPPDRKIISEERFSYLPSGEVELAYRIAGKEYPEGIHLEVQIKQTLPNGKVVKRWVMFPYNAGAAKAAKEFSLQNGGNGIVWDARYSPSKYITEHTDYTHVYRSLKADYDTEKSRKSSEQRPAQKSTVPRKISDHPYHERSEELNYESPLEEELLYETGIAIESTDLEGNDFAPILDSLGLRKIYS